MKKSISIVIGLLSFICLFVLVTCEVNTNGGFSLSGTLTKSGVDGELAYLKLVASGAAPDTQAIYFAVSTPFSAGTATYSVTGIDEGQYTGYAFIDVNGNATGDESSLPDSGDFITDEGADVNMTGDLTLDINESDWSQL